MPCVTYPDYEREDEEARENAKIRAALCMFLRVSRHECGPDFGLCPVDYETAGITAKWLQSWWKKHLKEDDQKKREESEKARKKEVREKALQKLTAEERKALGLKT